MTMQNDTPRLVYAAVFDLDGVLTDPSHRLPLILNKPKRWDEFYARAKDDAPLQTGLDLIHSIHERMNIIYVTGRREGIRQDTLEWLAKYGLPSGPLLMRPEKDYRPSYILKIELIKPLLHVIKLCVDDDPGVCDAYEEVGSPIIQVIQATWSKNSSLTWDSSPLYQDPDYKKSLTNHVKESEKEQSELKGIDRK